MYFGQIKQILKNILPNQTQSNTHKSCVSVTFPCCSTSLTMILSAIREILWHIYLFQKLTTPFLTLGYME